MKAMKAMFAPYFYKLSYNSRLVLSDSFRTWEGEIAFIAFIGGLLSAGVSGQNPRVGSPVFLDTRAIASAVVSGSTHQYRSFDHSPRWKLSPPTTTSLRSLSQ